MNNNRNNRRRSRNNSRGQGGGNQANRIDSRARGNAPQLLDKYKKLAQDAQHNGDRVQMEYYLQFADHYFRVVNDNKARQEEARAKRHETRDNGRDGERESGKDAERESAQDARSGDDDGRSEGKSAEGKGRGRRRSSRDQAREQDNDKPRRRAGRKPVESADDSDSAAQDDGAAPRKGRSAASGGKANGTRTSRTSRKGNGNGNGDDGAVSSHLPADNDPAPYPPAEALAIDEDVLPPPIKVDLAPENLAENGADNDVEDRAPLPRRATPRRRKAEASDDDAGLSAAG